MTLDNFPNAKPILLGEDTHAANLSGSVVADLTINQTFPAPAAGGCAGNAPTFTTIGSTSLTITHAINELSVRGQARFQNSSANQQIVRIIRDGDEGDVLAQISTGVQTVGSWFLNATIINETVGAHTYQWQIKNGDGNTETCCVVNTTFYNIFSEADDTHAANLTGDNTQVTHEQGELPA